MELRGLNFNNDYEYNWRGACDAADATPGSPPEDACTSSTESCGVGGSSDNQCSIHGGSGITCDSTGYYCSCPTTLLGDTDTCIDSLVNQYIHCLESSK